MSCECTFNKKCHIARQHLQTIYRERDPNWKIEDCEFYFYMSEEEKEKQCPICWETVVGLGKHLAESHPDGGNG